MQYMLPACCCFGSSIAGTAHEGHDHAEPASAPALQTRTLRINSTSDLIELVAIAGDRQLDVYLDQVDSNTPVIGARLELEADGKTSAARVVGDHYQIDAHGCNSPDAISWCFRSNRAWPAICCRRRSISLRTTRHQRQPALAGRHGYPAPLPLPPFSGY